MKTSDGRICKRRPAGCSTAGTGRLGFRADWDRGGNRFTLQADAYDGELGIAAAHSAAFGSIEIGGTTCLDGGRGVSRAPASSSQSYYDHTERDDSLFFGRRHLHVEVTHSIPHGKNNLLWGGGYRLERRDQHRIRDHVHSHGAISHGRTCFCRTASAERARQATVGLKLENNDYTGTESLPSVRLAWKPSDNGSYGPRCRACARRRVSTWTCSSRHAAVPRIGGPNTVSRVADVIGVGYRAEPTER